MNPITMRGTMDAREIHVRVHLEDDALWATIVEYPGVFAAGESLVELRESLQEGLALYLSEPGREVSGAVLTLLPVEVEATAGLTVA